MAWQPQLFYLFGSLCRHYSAPAVIIQPFIIIIQYFIIIIHMESHTRLISASSPVHWYTKCRRWGYWANEYAARSSTAHILVAMETNVTISLCGLCSHTRVLDCIYFPFNLYAEVAGAVIPLHYQVFFYFDNSNFITITNFTKTIYSDVVR